MKIGDKVTVGSFKTKPIDSEPLPKVGVIKDFKWNLIYVGFEDGRHEWVDSKWVHKYA